MAIDLKVLHVFIVYEIKKIFFKATLHKIFLKEDLPGEKEGMGQLNHSNCSTPSVCLWTNDRPSYLLKLSHIAVVQELDWILKGQSRTYCCCFTLLKSSIGTGFQITWGLSKNRFLFLDQKPSWKYNQEKRFNAYQKNFYFLMTAETMEGFL